MAQQIAIIGAGMAGLALADRLLDFVISNKIQIRLFDAASLAPSASVPSTAIVARYGLKPGLSPLGDELDESFSLACLFYDQYLGRGVERVSHWHVATLAKRSAHLHRFHDQTSIAPKDCPPWMIPQDDVFKEVAYMITPEIFLPLWKNELLQRKGIEFQTGLVIESDESSVLLSTGERFSYDKLFWCHGASGEGLMRSKVASGKKVTGHVYRYSKVDLGAESFVMGIDGKNCVYRALTGDLFVGGTSVEACMLPDFKTLEKQRRLFCEHTQGKLASLLQSPGEIQGGPRHKASQRRISTQSLETNQYKINGLYKNGYSSCFLASKRARDWLNL